MTKPKKVKIDLTAHAQWWMDPVGNINLMVPNDNLSFFTMLREEGNRMLIEPNAYPPFIWSRLGWECLGKFNMDPVEQKA